MWEKRAATWRNSTPVQLSPNLYSILAPLDIPTAGYAGTSHSAHPKLNSPCPPGFSVPTNGKSPSAPSLRLPTQYLIITGSLFKGSSMTHHALKQAHGTSDLNIPTTTQWESIIVQMRKLKLLSQRQSYSLPLGRANVKVFVPSTISGCSPVTKFSIFFYFGISLIIASSALFQVSSLLAWIAPGICPIASDLAPIPHPHCYQSELCKMQRWSCHFSTKSSIAPAASKKCSNSSVSHDFISAPLPRVISHCSPHTSFAPQMLFAIPWMHHVSTYVSVF